MGKKKPLPGKPSEPAPTRNGSRTQSWASSFTGASIPYPPTVGLKAGRKYPILVEYREETQNAHVRLLWSSDSRPREIVPQSRLFSEVGQTKADGLLGVYASLQPYLVYTVNNDNLYAISLEWPGDTLILSPGLEQAPYRVSLLGREGELPWRYENGELHIDLSELGYAEVPGKYAWVFRIE